MKPVTLFPAGDIMTGRLVGLSMVPLQARRCRRLHPVDEAACWLSDKLAGISRPSDDGVSGDGVSRSDIHRPAEPAVMPTSLRLFLAIDPPAETSALARRIVGRLTQAGLDATWVAPEALHLTLHFLGNDIDPSRLPAICAAIDLTCGRTAPFALGFGGLGAFPDMRQPRTVWLGVRRGAEPLVQFQAALAAALGPLGFPAEARGYHPHLTLGRLRPGSRRRDPAAAESLASEAKRLADEEAGQFVVHEATLYSSRLEPDGPVHSRLHTAKLCAPQDARHA